MSIWSTVQAYQAPITLLAVIFGPVVLPRVLALIRRAPLTGQPAQPRVPPKPLPLTLKAFLIFHTLYQLSHLLFPPYDIFVSNKLSILVPNASLRHALTNQSHSSTLAGSAQSGLVTSTHTSSPLVELLLSKLSNLDNRYLYARFGHTPLLECLWCETGSKFDYFLYALPRILVPYLGGLILLGLLSSGLSIRLPLPLFSSSSRSNGITDAGTGAGDGGLELSLGGPEGKQRGERWGGLCAWALGLGCLAELGVKFLWDVRAVEGDCIHLASTINHLRPILLLSVPLLLTFLPAPPPAPPTAAITATNLLPLLANTQNTLRMTSLLRSSTQQNPALRAKWLANGERESAILRRIGEDEPLRNATDGWESGIRADARRWVEEGWRGLVRIENQGASHGGGWSS